MLYNLAQSPISDGLRQYLLNQVPGIPPQEVLDQLKARFEAKKLGDWFDKITFPKTVSVDDIGGRRPHFFVSWKLNPSASRVIVTSGPDRSRPLLIIDSIEIDLRDELKIEVKPPDKLAMLHGYASEGYLQPTTWFYCLPEEVEGLKKKALDAAMRPFEDIREIDFTKPEEQDELATMLNALEEQGDVDPTSNPHNDL